MAVISACRSASISVKARYLEEHSKRTHLHLRPHVFTLYMLAWQRSLRGLAPATKPVSRKVLLFRPEDVLSEPLFLLTKRDMSGKLPDMMADCPGLSRLTHL